MPDRWPSLADPQSGNGAHWLGELSRRSRCCELLGSTFGPTWWPLMKMRLLGGSAPMSAFDGTEARSGRAICVASRPRSFLRLRPSTFSPVGGRIAPTRPSGRSILAHPARANASSPAGSPHRIFAHDGSFPTSSSHHIPSSSAPSSIERFGRTSPSSRRTVRASALGYRFAHRTETPEEVSSRLPSPFRDRRFRLVGSQSCRRCSVLSENDSAAPTRP